MRVGFTLHAVGRLRQIESYVSADSPENATRLIARIVRRAESLGEQPLRGRKVSEYERDDVREVTEPPYRIIYLATSEAVLILTIMHQRQLLPPDLPVRA